MFHRILESTQSMHTLCKPYLHQFIDLITCTVLCYHRPKPLSKQARVINATAERCPKLDCLVNLMASDKQAGKSHSQTAARARECSLIRVNSEFEIHDGLQLSMKCCAPSPRGPGSARNYVPGSGDPLDLSDKLRFPVFILLHLACLLHIDQFLHHLQLTQPLLSLNS